MSNELIRDAVARHDPSYHQSYYAPSPPPNRVVNSVATAEAPSAAKRYEENIFRIDGAITEQTVADVRDFLAMAPGPTIYVGVASRGGDFFAAIDILNLLRSSPHNVVGVAQGVCVSAGAVILLGANNIKATRQSILMFHPAAISSLTTANVEDLKKKARMLESCNAQIAALVAAKTGKDLAWAAKFVSEERYLTASEASTLLIVDEII